METTTTVKVNCYHCGDECRNLPLRFNDKEFCCEGCRLVYEVLQENNLCSYYRFNEKPGISPEQKVEGRFGYLDDASVKKKLVVFDDGKFATVNFYIPKMHCSSCIWLLENLQRINAGVVRSRVNFLNREVNLVFRQDLLSLRQLVELLSMIGYEPVIRLDDLDDRKKAKKDHSVSYKIGIAGFAFGNIMLFSFPEYFSLSDATDPGFKGVFSYINFFLSLPVFFYCSAQFFTSAVRSVNQKFLNIDVPIALGILVMFVRSTYEIFSGTGPGYMDTMAGLVFFMLLGRWFQDKTYKTLSFDRDYKSFFPVSVMVRRQASELAIPLSELRIGDRMLIRSEEIIPADAVLIQGDAFIDYSFVTGESLPVRKANGELLYAGGRQQGGLLEMEVVKEVSQSYLTQLWNNDRYIKKHDDGVFQLLVNRISHYFTFVIVAVAVIALFYWAATGDFPRGWNAFTAVLIIACPCALAISSPFTLGNILRIFGRNRFYLRGYAVIEKLAKVDTVVFDKTGTVTTGVMQLRNVVCAEGIDRHDALRMIGALELASEHPIARAIAIAAQKESGTLPDVQEFVSLAGMGARGVVEGVSVMVGHERLLQKELILIPGPLRTALADARSQGNTAVVAAWGGSARAVCVVADQPKSTSKEAIATLRAMGLAPVLLTGDNQATAMAIALQVGIDADDYHVRGGVLPDEKVAVIRELQDRGYAVAMVGDGVNDAAALAQADVGIAMGTGTDVAMQASDLTIVNGDLRSVPDAIRLSRATLRTIRTNVFWAFAYNVAAIPLAASGRLNPMWAGLAMASSSVFVVTNSLRLRRVKLHR